MVLGLRSKNKKGASIQVDFTIHIQEIKPWPPSQSLKSIRSVVLQWENGDRNSGSMSPVAPLLTEGKIEFNDSFKLQATFLKDPSVKGNDTIAFQKNVLELNLYEPRRDRTAKGQLLGTALIDLAEHGMVREAVVISVPVNCKRSFRTTAQPLLYVKIQPLNKDDGNSSSKESSSKEVVLDKDSKESVSALMNEEYAEEAEVASFTDDDVSSHSSLTNGSSPLETNADLPVQGSPREVESSKDMSEVVRESREADNVGAVLPLESVPPKPELKQETTSFHLGGTVNPNGSLPQASLIETSVDSEILDADASLSEFPPKSLTLCSEKCDNLSMDSSSSTVTSEAMEEEIVSVRSKEDVDGNDTIQEVEEDMEHDRTDENVARNSLKEEIDICGMANQVGSLDDLQNEKSNLGSIAEAEQNVDKDEKSQESGNELEEVARGITSHQLLVDETLNGPEEKVEEIGGNPDKIECITENLSSKLPITAAASLKHTPSLQQQSYLQSDLKTSYRTMSSRRFRGENSNRTLINDRLKNLKFSAMLPSDSFGNIASANCDLDMEEVKEIDVQEDVHNDSKNFVTDDGIDDHESTRSNLDKVKHISGNRKESISDKKIQELEVRLEMLEGELREAAAIEIGLYSVVAEHGSSVQKVHTPARRISRYWSRDRRASAARSAVSGLVMAAKACGNDVPRLTFWLSNCVVLRAIVTQAIKNQNIPVSGGPYAAPNGTQIALKNRSSQLKWESSVHKKEEFSFSEEYEDWEDPYTFAAALKKIEAWIFSRLVESVWWQTLTPHMQSPSEGAEPKKDQHRMITYGRTPSLGDQQQANLSIEIWKKAFKDACERLCPVRAGGHECGCQPMLSRLVMEQCIARLDVAMFNAILRESDDEIPTDPVSDPISDSKVLPIPSGKSSFGAGAQLKNAIGNWSRWLTDLFGMDTDDSPRGNNEQEEDRLEFAGSFKSFHLLNALSDLLMLPKDMLLDSSIRKEVCPTFNASMIKRILESFQPDEFCPDSIPDVVFDALDSEDPLERTEEGIRNFPCNASSIIYSPPPLALIETIIGDVQSVSSLRRSGSSVVRKCHTSDDELDELESPLTSIVIKAYTPNGKPNGNSCGMAVRYKLLREVWRDGN